MAATPSKPSPSQQSATAETTSVSKDAPPQVEVDQDSTTTTADDVPPIVATTSTESAAAEPPPQRKAPPASSLPTYESAEASQYYTVAKTLLNEGDFEAALSTIEEGIEAIQAQLPPDESLHESLAPFHYLYGTTLLYSIEESVDPQQQMTNEVTSGGNDDHNNNDAVADSSRENADAEVQPEEEGMDNQNVEDLQIAWENLETARNILERLVQAKPTDEKLKADLAQVHLRCGDLQRQNSAYENAVADYTACLQYRQSISIISKYSRKIADVHYQLGLVYFNQVAETKIPQDNSEESVQLKKNVEAARSQAYFHFFECGKIFGGILAELCGANPAEMLKQADHIPNFKTTGDDELNSSNGHDHPKILGMKLKNLIDAVAQLKVPEAAQLDFNDCMAVLEEIQETIDEAENSEKGVHEAQDMKEEIAAAVAAQAAVSDEDGSTTTIGFGSASAAASTAAANPVMIVTKKKKRNVEEDGEEAMLPSKEPDKRQKSNE